MSRYFFQPGPVPMEETIKIEWSHRSHQFQEIFHETRALLSGLTRREVAIIQGSASAAIESVLDGMDSINKRAMVVNNGAFAQRVVSYLNIEGLPVTEVDSVDKAVAELTLVGGYYDAIYVVQFETSTSIYNDCEKFTDKVLGDRPLIVDAVSAFPYYKLPSTADVVILSSSKQLRGLPVLGIVAYRHPMEKCFKKDNSYLNLRNAIEYGKCGQSPHTSMIPQMVSLHRSLKEKLWEPFVNMISLNATVLTEELEAFIVGEVCAPVVTIQTKDMDETMARLRKVGLDVYHNSYLGSRFQVSCFNYAVAGPYEELNEELIGCAEDGLL